MRLDETIASDGTSSVVAVVTNGNGEILLGKSTDPDHRNGKWCFTGGGIKNKEISIETAAERECWEESGIRCRAVGVIQYGNGFEVPPCVVFILCVADHGGNIRHNNEFSEMRWVTPSEALSWHDLFQPNRSIIEKLMDHPLMEEASHGSKDQLRAFLQGHNAAEQTLGIGNRIVEIDPPKGEGTARWGIYDYAWDLGWYYRSLIGPIEEEGWWKNPNPYFEKAYDAIRERKGKRGSR